jgi:hypothetical protein
MPIPFQVLFAVAVVGLGGAVLFAATGGLGRVAAALGSTFTGFVEDLTATPVPTSTPTSLGDSPLLEEPSEPYTNVASVDLVGTIPDALVGSTASRIRIYVAIGEQDPAPVVEVPIGKTPRFIVPGVGLVEGPNAFSATIVNDGGESEPSPTVTYVLDATIPRIVLSAPANGAVVNAKSARIEGETQPRSMIQARNATSGAIVNGQADASGLFSVLLPLVAGNNDIGVTSVDPAGNENHAVIAVTRGSGVLAASISASTSQIKRSSLPSRLELATSVTDPDGKPLAGARITFSLAVPGVPAVTSKTIETGGDGVARWSTTIPGGATTGLISATVIVKTAAFGELTDRTVITIVK